MSTQSIDYAALAKQAGAISSTPASGVDYTALAKQAGAISSTPATSPAPQSSPSVWSQIKQALSEPGQAAKQFMDAVTGSHPIDDTVDLLTKMGQQLTQGRQTQQQKALDAYKAGNYKQAAEHALFSVPIIGPMAGAAAEESKTQPVLAGIHMGELAAPAAGEALEAVRGALPESIPIFPKMTNPNPVEAAAVKWGMTRDPAMVDAAMATGNPAVRGVQFLADRSIGGSLVATPAKQAQAAALARTGAELADEVHPIPTTPEEAGAAIPRALQKNIADVSLERDAAYAKAWEGRNDPAQTQTVPVSTQKQPVLDAEGKPTGATQDVPVMKRVNMPVDVRDIKSQARPIWEEMQWMPAADQASSAGYTAVKKILNGDDFIPAWQAERGLSGLKTMARVTSQSGVRDVGQGVAASLIGSLQDGVDAAVAKTGDPAIQGLQEGRAAHATVMDIADLADKIREEPVQAFNQATFAQDRGIAFLRKIADQAPDLMPQIGRAFIQNLFDRATTAGAFNRTDSIYRSWENLGPETKQLLFDNPNLRSSLDNFFTLAKKAGENPNPSGTAYVGALGAQGYMVKASPMTGIPLQIGAAALSKLLHSPRGINLLTDGLRIPLGGARGVATANALTKLAEESADEEPPNPSRPAPNTPPPPAGSGTGPGQTPIAKSPVSGTVTPGANDAGEAQSGQPEGAAVPQPAGPGGQGTRGERTAIRIPGGGRIQATYVVRELGDVHASHNAFTFEPNPQYQFLNDRDYTEPAAQARVITHSGSQFDPYLLVSDNVDAMNGPSIIDKAGNVLGGNNRQMSMDRVYSLNAAGKKAYGDLLLKKAPNFGLDPAAISAMKRPVLLRELDESPANPQRAITDLNKPPTAALSTGERATADARSLSPETAKYINQALESAPSEASLNDVLSTPRGPFVVNQLIRDGIFTEEERPALIDPKSGDVTKAAKDRIGKMLVGNLFQDSEQFQNVAPSVRNTLERIAAPLMKVQNSPEWDLTADVRGAVARLDYDRTYKEFAAEYKKSHGFSVDSPDAKNQTGMFEGEAGPARPQISAGKERQSRLSGITWSRARRNRCSRRRRLRTRLLPMPSGERSLDRPPAAGLLSLLGVESRLSRGDPEFIGLLPRPGRRSRT